MIPKESIERFFKNECTAEERAAIAAYFEEHPEELDLYTNENDWGAFSSVDKLPSKISAKIWQKVTAKTNKRKLVIRRIGLVAAAACLLFLAGTGWNFFNSAGEGQKPLTAIVSANENVLKNTLTKRVNRTGEPMQLVTDDGTVIELMPNSSVEYAEPFVKDNKRTVYLTGEALFKVAKDKLKPFTVYSGAIATTALGTSFTIRSFEKDNYIKVHLHTGKVVVKSADSMHKQLAKDMFMVPGNILMYNKDSRVARITSESRNALAKNTAKEEEHYTIPNWYMFSNQSLSQVFDQLEEMYGVTINYSNADLKSMYFIGKFDKTDSIDNILTTIASLNKLTVNKKGGTYTVNRLP